MNRPEATESARMRAVVIERTGPPEVLELREVPIPVPRAGEVLIRVRAFGLNRSELHFRTGLAASGSLPRIPGIEAVGEVELAPGGELPAGTRVMTMMGGMGREFDGGYAEHVVVPVAQTIPFRSTLGWEVLGAIPEMLQTAYGSLAVGVRAEPGQTLLIRGGTSSVGLAAAVLATRMGIRVLSTTRRPEGRDLLTSVGVEHPLLDDGDVAAQAREIVPEGADGAIELVGAPALKDTLRAVRPGGTVCFTGMLSDEWSIQDFYPMDWLPNGVRLTAYSGEAADLPADVLQGYLEDVEAGRAVVPLGRSYRMEQIVQAHRGLEAGSIGGKGVVLT